MVVENSSDKTIVMIFVTESWGSVAVPFACLDLLSVLVEIGPALDHNFSFIGPSCSKIKYTRQFKVKLLFSISKI